MYKKLVVSLFGLLSLGIVFAQSEFQNTYTRLVEGIFSEGAGSMSTGTMVESGVLNLSIKGQLPEMKGLINMSMRIPYTTYTNDQKKYQSYSKFAIDVNIGGSFDELVIPNTPVSIEMETIVLSHYMYYKVKRLDFDVSQWNSTNEDLQGIKEFLLSDGKNVYMNRWIRVRVPQESQEILEGGYNTLNIQAIKDFLIKNPIFKQIGITNKGYIITFDETNLQKLLPTEFADRLNEIKERANIIEKNITLINSGSNSEDTDIITGTMSTGSIPTVEFLLQQDKNLIQMNMNEREFSIKSKMTMDDNLIKLNLGINNLGNQSYKLGLGVNYLNNTTKDNLDLLIENTSSYLFLGKNMKIHTPIRAKTIDQIRME